VTGPDDLSWLRHRGHVVVVGGGDLSWIRHRRLPAGATASPPTAAPAPATTSLDLSSPTPPAASTSLDLSAPSGPPPVNTSLDLSGPSAPPPGNTSLDLSAPSGHPPAPSPGNTSLDLPAPSGPPPVNTSLDLSAPSGPPQGPPSIGNTSLDLSARSGPPPGPPPGSTSLDLSGEATQDPVPFAAPAGLPRAAPVAAAAPAFTPPRTHASAPTVLTPQRPSVQLSRLQSGIGALTFEAAWSPDEGFVLGCAYEMDSGWSSVLRPGETFGPLTMDRRAGHQRLRLDLLHGRHLRRLIVFGVPAVDPGPHWAGTLLISTHGHARVEIPVEPPPPGPTVLLSLYNVDGEIVLRAEAQTVPGRIRDACLAFGYDRIAWRDADTAIPPAT
jgi:hypothetical protein